MRYRHLSIIVTLATLLLAGVSAAGAQGTRDAPQAFTRGKSLADWIAQAGHYIPEMRREAVKAIATLGPAAQDALPVLIRSTRDEDEEVRFWAVEAIRRMGGAGRDAAPALLVVLSNDTRRLQDEARRAFEAIGAPAVPVLIPALRSPDPWVRANAAEALGTIGDARDKVVPELIRLLSDDTLWVRSSAAWAIGDLGGDAHAAAKPLARCLVEELRRDPTLSDPGIRVRVEDLVYALGRLGDHASGAVAPVMTVLYDGDDSLRAAAAAALAGIGHKAAEPLGRAVRSAPLPVRMEAARALRLMGPEAKHATRDLIKVLEANDELEGGHDLVIATADALGAIGHDAKAALGILERQRRQSASSDVVEALDRAIRKIREGA